MKRLRFTEEQILAILKEQDCGSKVMDICHKHGISDATFHSWKSKYSGMTSRCARDAAPLNEIASFCS